MFIQWILGEKVIILEKKESLSKKWYKFSRAVKGKSDLWS